MMPYVEIVRPRQQYKNLLVFLPIIFSLQLFEPELFLDTIVGFAILCLAFGGMYAFNDVIDSRHDKIHPEKSKRPIPSGRIKKRHGIVFACTLLALSLTVSILQDFTFFLTVSAMILLTVLYSVRIKNVMFLDVFAISSNFVLRGLCGAFLADIAISPWLVVGIFLAALLLSFGKRFNEIRLLKARAMQHRHSLKNYTPGMLRVSLIATSSALLSCFLIYAVTPIPGGVNDWRLVFTVPVAVFIVAKYVSTIQSGTVQDREFHSMIFAEKKLFGAILLFVVLVMALLYVVPVSYLV